MANKHTATAPDGSIMKRTSANRVYSHVTVGRPSYEHAVAEAKAESYRATDKRNFAYYAEIAAQTPGVARTIHVDGCARPWSYEKAETAEEIAAAVAKLAGATSGEEFHAIEQERRLAKVEEAKARGAFASWVDLGWSSSAALAAKNAASHRSGYYAEVVVLPATVA